MVSPQPTKNGDSLSLADIGKAAGIGGAVALIGVALLLYWDYAALILGGCLVLAAFCGFIYLVVWAFAGQQQPPQKIRKTILDRDGNVVGYIEEDAPAENTWFFIWWN